VSTACKGAGLAEALLGELGESARDLPSIAARLNLGIREVDADGFDGALVRARELPVGTIVVRESIREASRKNFTIAHEIGHFVIPEHEDGGVVCTARDVGNWSDPTKHREREADEFAAALLMPAALVEPILRSATPCMRVIEQIAQQSGSSLSAAAWRYCDLATEPVAIVWSTDKQIQWSRHSATFGFALRKGTPVEKGTFAFACFGGATGAARPEPVFARLWTTGLTVSKSKQATIWEQSKALPTYNSVISLLWLKKRD
jgi:IrrE N-terminal-like domain